MFNIENIAGQHADDIVDKPRNERIIRADSCINILKTGVPLVRLPSRFKTIAYLEKVIASKNSSKAKKQRLKKQLNQIIEERDDLNQRLLNAFYQKYTFSDFLVLYDSSSYQLNAGVQKGYFLDEFMKIDPELSLDNRAYLLVHVGRGHYAQVGTVTDGLYFKDAQAQYIVPPFPDFSSRIVFVKLLKSILRIDREKIPLDVKLDQVVERGNQNLKLYWKYEIERNY